MIEIPLSKTGKHAGKYVAIVDDEDGDLADFDWVFNNGYATRQTKGSAKDRGFIQMHRLIMEQILGHSLARGSQVDHVNLNRLDNRRENLRLSNKSQNAANTTLRKSNKSGYKGVNWSKPNKKWQAAICHQYHRYHLGFFDTPEEAHAAYCEKAKELHGEFARFE